MTSAAPLPSLSVVIPTYNQRDLLVRCVRSVIAYAPAGTEVIVVDDASRDGSAEAVLGAWPSVRMIRHPKNQGFCSSANDGWQAAGGEVVELLNNDAEVTKGWADAPLRAFRDPRVGVVAPLVRQMPFRGRIDSAGDSVDWLGVARKRLEGAICKQAPIEQVEVFSASASSAFYRRQALEAVGGFPERYISYFDDVDLGYRLRAANWKCLLVPESQVFHWVSQSHRHASRATQHRISLNSERLFWSNLKRFDAPVRGPLRLAYLLALLTYKGLKGEFGPWYSGKCALLKDVPYLLRNNR